MPYSDNIEIAKILTSRLERLSADSYWAHRASGIRGALLRLIENADINDESYKNPSQIRILESLIKKGYFLLEKAAREIPEHK